MDHTALVLFYALIVCCLLNPMVPSHASAADSFAGNIASIESDSPSHFVNIIRSGKTAGIPANLRDALFKGDKLKTDVGVKAQIELSDGSMINVGPNSSIQMKDYLLDPSRSKRSYSIKALSGSIRFIITKLFRNKFSGAETSWQNSDVTIETPTAIAGIRGTDLITTIGDGEDEVAVLEGLVRLRSSARGVPGEVLLGANAFSRIKKGLPPAPPFILSPQRREGLIHQTTPAKPLLPPQRGAGASGKPPKDAKEVSLLVAREVAAGVPLKDIMSKAVEEGVDIATLVAAMLEAGLDVRVVVYTAIREGYEVQTVVKAAIKEGASLEVVVNAALSAGADSKAVSAGAMAAGAAPADVANALAATSPPAGGGAPSVYTPPASVTVGGGGGATPSTETASPVQP